MWQQRPSELVWESRSCVASADEANTPLILKVVRIPQILQILHVMQMLQILYVMQMLQIM